MKRKRDSVTVRVPGSTSNCGAGFDTLGLALAVHNRITITADAGAGPRPERPADGRAAELVAAAAGVFFRDSGIPPAGFRYRIGGAVPPARGLGSSVTIIAGVLAGLDVLHGAGWSREKLVALTTEIEGHPDNASAGILGGFCVARCDPKTGAYVGAIRRPVPARLAFVVASPAVELLTRESRAALPGVLPYFDAVRSINSAAYFVAAMMSGDYDRLEHAAGDFMHEPYRLPGIRGGAEAIAAGVAAGARTGWLSGSGSSVLCVAPRAIAAKTGAAMRRAFRDNGTAATVRILAADNRGLMVE